MEKEHILIMWRKVTMKVIGQIIKWKEVDILNYPIVFTKEISNKITKMVSESNFFQMETNITESIALTSSMDKESIFGQMDHLTLARFIMDIGISMENGYLQEKYQIFIKEITLKTGNMAWENMFGVMVASMKEVLTTILSNFGYI